MAPAIPVPALIAALWLLSPDPLFIAKSIAPPTIGTLDRACLPKSLTIPPSFDTSHFIAFLIPSERPGILIKLPSFEINPVNFRFKAPNKYVLNLKKNLPVLLDIDFLMALAMPVKALPNKPRAPGALAKNFLAQPIKLFLRPLPNLLNRTGRFLGRKAPKFRVRRLYRGVNSLPISGNLPRILVIIPLGLKIKRSLAASPPKNSPMPSFILSLNPSMDSAVSSNPKALATIAAIDITHETGLNIGANAVIISDKNPESNSSTTLNTKPNPLIRIGNDAINILATAAPIGLKPSGPRVSLSAINPFITSSMIVNP